MVKLFNIRVDGDKLICDYTPESSKSVGHLVYDIEKDAIVEEHRSEFDRNIGTYTHFAQLGLRGIAKKGPPYTQERTVMWY